MGLRDLLDEKRPDSVEDFLLRLVAVVRDDEEDEERDRGDVYREARKRRRRLAVIALAAGPLVGAANQLADLYCEAGVVCDVADLDGLELSDAEIAAHLLELWGIADDQEAARASIAGEPPVASLLADRLSERAGEQLPPDLTVLAVTKALWHARGGLGDAREAIGGGAFKAIVFTGRRTKQVIARAEAQLGVAPAPKSRWRR